MHWDRVDRKAIRSCADQKAAEATDSSPAPMPLVGLIRPGPAEGPRSHPARDKTGWYEQVGIGLVRGGYPLVRRAGRVCRRADSPVIQRQVPSVAAGSVSPARGGMVKMASRSPGTSCDPRFCCDTSGAGLGCMLPLHPALESPGMLANSPSALPV
jgi:hypothetical protein